MSVTQTAPPDRGVSPLMSNNPFRNKVASSSTSPVEPSRGRPVSTNPFLDVTEVNKDTTKVNTTTKVEDVSVDKAAVIFDSMEIKDSPASAVKGPIRTSDEGPRRRPENVPPQGMRRPPPPGHRPVISEEERRRRMQGKPRGEMDVFADPSDAPKIRERRPRRNSESSVRDRTTKLLDPEEEKKRQERKRRESKRAGSTKSGKPNRRLDVIDKLDVTSIYGTGLFHHDGPFDACNPHRNRKKERFAPIQAFPKDSINMVVGGSGPVNKRMDYAKFHGHGQEAHIDYNEAAVADEETSTARPRRPFPERSASFNPLDREEIHGDESAGLGTSTFLEGAPASRAAIQRRESENVTAQVSRDGAPGLSRKKSLAQKLRGVRPNRDRFASPDGRSPPTSPPITGQSDSAANPFFESFDKEPRQKSVQAVPAEAEEETTTGRARAPSSPMKLTLERRNTTQADGPTDPAAASATTAKAAAAPTGFLGRMKSLKSGSKPRPARRETSG